MLCTCTLCNIVYQLGLNRLSLKDSNEKKEINNGKGYHLDAKNHEGNVCIN